MVHSNGTQHVLTWCLGFALGQHLMKSYLVRHSFFLANLNIIAKHFAPTLGSCSRTLPSNPLACTHDHSHKEVTVEAGVRAWVASQRFASAIGQTSLRLVTKFQPDTWTG
eukprot:3864584-Amphidinium_carterae.1